MILTYRYRVKDKHSSQLNKMARSVNCVWNYCNDMQKHSIKWNKKLLTTYDLNNLTTGAAKELNLHSGTIQDVCGQYRQSRREQKKPYLRYRSKKNLGWIPIEGRHTRFVSKDFKYAGKLYSLWNSRTIPENARICDKTCFSQDSRGRWYLNVIIELPDIHTVKQNRAVGIDLGLKSLASLSSGEVIQAPRFYRTTEQRLAKAQRANKKKLVKTLSAKIANQRKDFAHKFTTDIVKRFDHIVVGNINAKGLARTKMAKSVHDAGWSILRNQLSYKCNYAGGRYEEVNEAYSSQICCECGCISASSPRGAKDLAVREWTCSECSSVNDRDINAAKNILRSGHGTQFAGIAA